jgi:hypothetical protein
MDRDRSTGAGTFFLLLTAVIMVGTPLVAYLWETLNQLLAAQVNPRRLLISAPLLVVFLALLWFGGRTFLALFAPPPEPGQPSGEEPVVSGTLLLTAFILMFMFGAWFMMYVLLLNR